MRDARDRSADGEQSAAGKLWVNIFRGTLSSELGVDSESNLSLGALDHGPETGRRRYDVVGVGL